MTHIDYSKDLLKHYVRKYGWLPACQQQTIASKKKRYLAKYPLRYFTFCAAEAIDVFMLECEGILLRSPETGRLQEVYFCEKDEQDFTTIADLIGSPQQGFRGKFETIVLFEEDEKTRGKSYLDDESYPPHLLQRLYYKDTNHRLRNAFPFDIINLDLFGVMLPPSEGVIGPLLKALLRILEWQTEGTINDKPLQQFTLFLTSKVNPDETDKDAVEHLTTRMIDNLNVNANFQSVFSERYQHQDATKLRDENFPEFFCFALSKYIIEQALFSFGWEVSYQPVYFYNRPDTRANTEYQIMHSISVYTRTGKPEHPLSSSISNWYARTVAEVLNQGIEWVHEETKTPDVRQELDADLKKIVEYRNRWRERIS